MRFKKGSKVEVLNKNEVPPSWQVAEIISGNGRTYTVRYDCFPENDCGWLVDKVSRKFIRPCPLPLEGVISLGVGDIVEVFCDKLWKVATVLKVLGGDRFLVKPHGVTRELSVHKQRIRVRQLWQDDRWFITKKSSGIRGDGKFRKVPNLIGQQRLGREFSHVDSGYQLYGEDNRLQMQNDAEMQESHFVSSRMLKRLPPPLLEARARKAAKFGASQKVVPDQLLEKVDAAAFTGQNLGVKYMQASYNNCSNGYYEMERGKSNDVVGCSEYNNPDNVESSVGSCSSSRGPNMYTSPFVAATCQETDDLCSDAESFSESRCKEESSSVSPDGGISESIHRLELQAYHSTLEALYASGPLSWEKEDLLSNLRINLNISNDEHLVEIRSLLSPGAAFL